MHTMTLSLPDDLRDFVDEQVATQNAGSSSEYICALINKDRSRLQVCKLLHEGAESPQTGIADNDYFDSLRARALRSDRK